MVRPLNFLNPSSLFFSLPHISPGHADYTSSTGAICSQTPMARQPGTTITVFRLFEPLPVRRAEFKR